MIDNAIECPCFEVQQPVGRFYIARISADDLIAITHIDVRRIEREEREVETVLGIQRPLSKTRVKEIGDYVNTVDATFPTSVILAINSFAEDDETRNIYYEKRRNHLEIRRDEHVAKVLDGQHRIEGLRMLRPENRPFELVITIFVDADIEEQALIFATINKTQTKVNKSLVYDLFELAKSRSPEKTCHNIAMVLNRQDGSPFKDRIKVLGTADDAAMETLTQATFVEGLLQYISREPMKDRDFLKRYPNKKLPDVEPRFANTLFLRPWFRDGQDAKIAKLVWNYFAAVQTRWPRAWNSNERGLILNKSTGYIALMRFFKDACLYVHIEPMPTPPKFLALFEPVTLRAEDFTKEQFIPGSTGQRILYETIREQSPIPEPEVT